MHYIAINESAELDQCYQIAAMTFYGRNDSLKWWVFGLMSAAIDNT
jgi:hypothetical protein